MALRKFVVVRQLKPAPFHGQEVLLGARIARFVRPAPIFKSVLVALTNLAIEVLKHWRLPQIQAGARSVCAYACSAADDDGSILLRVVARAHFVPCQFVSPYQTQAPFVQEAGAFL